MVTLVVEDGSGKTNANTYVSRAEATTYHDAHLYADAWTDADVADQDRALAMATQLIDDYFPFEGGKVTETQALEWPRWNATDRDGWAIDGDEIPTAVKNATAELARWLLAENRTADDDTKGFKRMKVGPLELETDRTDRKPVLPGVVRQMLRPFGAAAATGGVLDLVRA